MRFKVLSIFALFASVATAQNYLTGTINSNQVNAASGAFNISLIPTGTTGTTVALGNDGRFGNATKLNGTDISSFAGIPFFTSGTPGTATYSNIVSLWSSCAAGTPLLSYNGTCIAASAGTVSSVALSAPSFFLVGGTPVTSAGTLAITYATGLTANQVLRTDNSGNAGLGALTAAMLPGSITSNTSGTAANVTGTVAIANGGTGATTAATGFNALSPLTTAGDTLYGGTSGAGTRLAAGTSTQVFHSGTTPSWGAVNLGTDVTGSLPSGSVSGLAASATTDTTNAANITSGTLPAGRLPTSAQVWNKYTIGYASVNAGSTAMAVTIVSLTARQLVCGLVQKTSTAFAGTSITGLTVTVGDSNGTSTTYSAVAYNLLQTVSNTAFVANNVVGMASFAGGTIQANFTSTGANLSSLTAGSIDFDVCVVTIP